MSENLVATASHAETEQSIEPGQQVVADSERRA